MTPCFCRDRFRRARVNGSVRRWTDRYICWVLGQRRERSLVIDVERGGSRAVRATTASRTTATAAARPTLTTPVATTAATAAARGTLKAGFDLDEDLLLLLSLGLRSSVLGLEHAT